MADMYVGINGKARKIIKAYVGVNGVARAITAGYAGVGGVARNVFSGATVAMPKKGDTIILKSNDNTDFEQYTFKVLSTSGSIAKLLFLNIDVGDIFRTPLTTIKWYNTSGESTGGAAGSTSSIYYSESQAYTTLNETFYQNFLPSDIQSGVDSANGTGIMLTQYKWYLSTGTEENAYVANCDAGIYFCVESGQAESDFYPEHAIYPLSMYDIIEYLGTTTSMGINDTTLTSHNLVNLMLPSSYTGGNYVPMSGNGYWLMDTNQDNTELIILNPTGNLETWDPSNEMYICPVMHIDLTDITWQTVEDYLNNV